MMKTAIGLFESSATADAVVALLLASGFSRSEVKLVKRSDFDARRSPETDILKIGGVPATHSGRYWEAVRTGRTLIAVSAGDRADRAVQIMDAEGAIYLEESITLSAGGSVHPATPSTDPGFYPPRQAAQVFEVS